MGWPEWKVELLLSNIHSKHELTINEGCLKVFTEFITLLFYILLLAQQVRGANSRNISYLCLADFFAIRQWSLVASSRRGWVVW